MVVGPGRTAGLKRNMPPMWRRWPKVTTAHPSGRDGRFLVFSNRGRLERQCAEDLLCGRLDAMQRLTQGIRVAVVELNVISGVYARTDADRSADDKRDGLGFGFAHGLGRRPVVAALMK
jgi:hypothetical protein